MTDSTVCDGARLRIFSANLLHGRADVSALSEQLNTLAPDIVALQEFTPQHIDAVRALLSHGEAPLAASRGMALALRHPASLEAVSRAGAGVFRALLEPDSWPGLPAPLEVLASHIRAPHSFPPWRTFAARRAQVRGLMSHIEQNPSLARVLVGDLNSTPRWPAYRLLSGALEDAAVVAAQQRGRQPQATWSPRRHGPRWFRIDHALVRGVRVQDLRVVRVVGSDHAGLVIDLCLARSG